MKRAAFFLILTMNLATAKVPGTFAEFLKANDINPDTFYLQSNCIIYTLDGKKLRDFGGELCLFEDNGNYLIAEGNGELNYRDKHNKILWSKPNVWAHHTLEEDSRGNFLVLSSEFKPRSTTGSIIRYDVFNVIAKESGAQKFTYSTFDHYLDITQQKILLTKNLWPVNWWKPLQTKAQHEPFHANSFHEITGLIKPVAGIKNKDYIVNLPGRIKKILFLDQNDFKLKKIIDAPADAIIHDVQLLPDGEIIFFNNTPHSKNLSRGEVEVLRRRPGNSSLIETMNISGKNIRSYFKDDSAVNFVMNSGGSLQRFKDGSILTLDFRNNKSTILFLNQKKEVLKKLEMDSRWQLGLPFVRLKNLSDFFKNNIGL